MRPERAGPRGLACGSEGPLDAGSPRTGCVRGAGPLLQNPLTSQTTSRAAEYPHVHSLIHSLNADPCSVEHLGPTRRCARLRGISLLPLGATTLALP